MMDYQILADRQPGHAASIEPDAFVLALPSDDEFWQARGRRHVVLSFSAFASA